MHEFMAISELVLIKPRLKIDLLPGNSVEISDEMSSAEFMRLFMTVASREQLGHQRMYEDTPLGSDREIRLVALLPGKSRREDQMQDGACNAR